MPLPPYFDAPATWSALSPEQQDGLGRLALVLACALKGNGADGGPGPDNLVRACDIAQLETEDQLVMVYELLCGADQSPRTPNLADIGMPVCRGCGCTDDHARKWGCFWVADGLCSACAEVGEQRPLLSAAAPPLPKSTPCGDCDQGACTMNCSSRAGLPEPAL